MDQDGGLNPPQRKKMIRAAAIAGGFLAVTLTLILVQKDNQPRPVATLEPRKSTPAQTQEPDVARSSPAAAPGVQDTPDQDVTRTKGGLTFVDPVVTAQPVAAAQAVRPSGVPSAARLANTHSATDLEKLIAGAMQQGQSPAYIAALVKNTTTGDTSSPAPRLVRDGALDTASLIGALAAPVSTAQGASEPVTYVVQPGDTLAAISYRFYGNTAHGPQIISANPESFETPTSLAIGQRLVVPAL